MNKTTKAFFSLLSLVFLVGAPVKADSLTDQLKTQQKQLEGNKKELKSAEDKREELELEIERLDNQIEDYMSQIEDNKRQIGVTEKQIEQTKLDLAQAEHNVEIQQEVVDQRLRAMYKSGQTSSLELLISAKNFSDLISRIEVIKRIADYDRQGIDELRVKKTEVEKRKTALDEQHQKLVALEAENESKLQSKSNDIAAQQKLIDEVEKQEKLYASNVDQSQALVDATLQQISSIRASTPKYTPSRGAAQLSVNNVIAYASNFLGTPYLWGGTSPSTGFDCSGFTQYVFAHFGVRLGRTTYNQIKDGYAVSKSELQPGDLVFFGRNGSPSHMGIYVGNNTYIHSPRTGDVIKISSLNRTDFITGRRVM